MGDTRKTTPAAFISLKPDALLGFNQAPELNASQGLKSQVEMSRLFSKRGEIPDVQLVEDFR